MNRHAAADRKMKRTRQMVRFSKCARAVCPPQAGLHVRNVIPAGDGQVDTIAYLRMIAHYASPRTYLDTAGLKTSHLIQFNRHRDHRHPRSTTTSPIGLCSRRDKNCAGVLPQAGCPASLRYHKVTPAYAHHVLSYKRKKPRSSDAHEAFTLFLAYLA